MRKICVFTGSRAEYGLLKPLMAAIAQDPTLTLQLLVSGMHLSPEFGLTYTVIEVDGFHIDEKVEMLMSSDTPIGLCKSMGLGMIGYSEALQRLASDIIVVLGDRFEAFTLATAAMISRIPIAHLYGGEVTEGVIDEPMRHAITKMSHLHFTSTMEYRKRVIQLGENPENVFHVGAIGIENITQLPLLSRQELAAAIHFSREDPYLLVTYHPVTLEEASASLQVSELLAALDVFTLPEGSQDETRLKIIFTKANADTDGRIINAMIDAYVARNPDRAIAFTSMGQLLYLSAMKHAAAVVGNSSSGIIEAPSFSVPTVNIGDRQLGRVRAPSIIDCEPTKNMIVAGLVKAFSQDFREAIESQTNPFALPNTAMRIKEILRNAALPSLLKKHFHDTK